MKLPADPYDFVIVQLDQDGGSIAIDGTSADLEAGEGATLPTIESGRWLAAYAVACTDPERVTLAQLRAGDLLLISDVTGDTITFSRTGTARVLNAGEYLFLSLTAYEWGVMKAKLETIEEVLALTVRGGADCVIRHGTASPFNGLKATEQDTPDMTVQVAAGIAFIDSQIVRLDSTTNSSTITAPSVNNRIDLVQLVAGVGGAADSVSIKAGSESASPVAPSVDSGALALAQILLTPATTTITNSAITDVRDIM